MSKKRKIILAEDEEALGMIVKESLETRGFEIILCKNGEEAKEQYHKETPDLLVLDVMMPQKDGFTVAKEIREIDSSIPIIFLTSKSRPEDVVEGFRYGANDYIKKPFSMEELIVRINALLDREWSRGDSQKATIGKYTCDFSKQKLQYENDPEILLTYKEAQLLNLLYQNKNELTDKNLILDKLWGSDDFFNSRSMDVFISKLRKKLSKDESIEIINLRGYGYKLVC